MEKSAPEIKRLKAGNQSATDPLEFVLSDETVDRVGDVVRADGWELDAFKQNPIALLGHDHQHIVGRWENIRVQGKRLLARLHFADADTSDVVLTARSLVEQGILKAVSVGFSVLDYEPIDKEKPYNGWDITRAALHEASLVAVPANPNALAVAKALNPDMAELFFARAGTDEHTGVAKVGRLAEKSLTPRMDTWHARLARGGVDIELE